MSDHNGHDKKTDDSKLPEDEEIIELTDVAQDTPAGDDDVIELTDVASDDDHDIIELTDVAMDDTREDDIIDLTDEATEEEIIDLTDEAGDEDVIDLLDVSDDTEAVTELTDVTDDEAPIVLDDVVETGDGQPDDAIGLEPHEASATGGDDAELDNELLELIESINDDDFDGSDIGAVDYEEEEEETSEDNLLEPDEDIEIPTGEQLKQESEESKMFAESLDDDLGSALTFSEDDLDEPGDGEKILDRPGVVSVKVQNLREEGPPVDFKFESRLKPGDALYREKDYNKVISEATTEQVEEAVRKVIKELLAEKIDSLITDVIEKKVLQEIDRIKTLLLGDMENDKR